MGVLDFSVRVLVEVSCVRVGVLMCLGMIPNTDGFVKISVVCRNYVLSTNLRLISRSIFFFFFNTHTC